MKHVLALVTFAALAIACAHTEPTPAAGPVDHTCRHDRDCAADMRCQQGQCVTPNDQRAQPPSEGM